jgi:hypothetical protein
MGAVGGARAASAPMSARRVEVEGELGRTAALVADVVEQRTGGNRNSLRGNSDEDLLGAVEELETAVADWRADQ